MVRYEPRHRAPVKMALCLVVEGANETILVGRVGIAGGNT